MDLSAALGVANTADRPRLDAERGVLVGTECRLCGSQSWPGRAVCQRCGSIEVHAQDLPRAGQLVTYTTAWVPRPGLEPPYVIGLVELTTHVRVFAHVRRLHADVAMPHPVELVVTADPHAVPPFWFEPT